MCVECGRYQPRSEMREKLDSTWRCSDVWNCRSRVRRQREVEYEHALKHVSWWERFKSRIRVWWASW